MMTTSDGSSDTVACPQGSEGCACYDDNSCDAGLICASNQCLAGNDTSSTSTDETSEGTTGSPTSGTGSESSTDPTTGSETTTGPSACDPVNGIANNDACETGKYCNAEGECVGCTGLTEAETCVDVDPNTPICNEALGNCVECLAEQASACTGNNPVCDDDTMTCGPCTTHGDCPSGACVLQSGACFPMDSVIWVDKLANCQDATGAFDKPYCEISDAVESVNANDPRLIRVLPTQIYTSPIVVPSGRTLAIQAGGNNNVRFAHRSENTDSLQISPNAQVYINSMRLLGLDDIPTSGVICSEGSLWIADSEIKDKKGLGIISNDCKITLAETTVFHNSRGGVQATDGTVRLENAVIGNNGSGTADVGGMLLKGEAALDAVYSTIAFNVAFAPDAIKCEGNAGGMIKSSIVIGSDDASSVVCDAMQITVSAIDTEYFQQDDANNKFFNPNNLNQAWFVEPGNGDFHLANGGSEFDGVAVWYMGDPMYDIDGEMRPSIDGAPDFAGADLP